MFNCGNVQILLQFIFCLTESKMKPLFVNKVQISKQFDKYYLLSSSESVLSSILFYFRVQTSSQFGTSSSDTLSVNSEDTVSVDGEDLTS